MEIGPSPRNSSEIVEEKDMSAHKKEAATIGHPGLDYAGQEQDEELEPEIHFKFVS